MLLIRKIFAWIRRNKMVKTIKRNIEYWSGELAFFKIIEIESSLFSDVDRLRGSKKYEHVIFSFDTIIKDIQNHNAKIYKLQTQFDSIVANHNIQNILSHIDGYTFEQLQSYNSIALQISEYRIAETFLRKDSYLRYIRDLGELISDYPKVLEQFSLIKDFEAISFSFGDFYIDAHTAEKTLAPAKSILEKVKTYGSKYYKIPQLDEKIIERHNEQYIRKHLNDSIFDNVNGKSLDEEQRRAILCDSKSNLTIAGAGAGKTLTICGKVKWLLDTQKASADEILLLSYSKASADDLAVKVYAINKSLTVKTFHSFGLDILNHAYGCKRAIEEQFKVYISKYFDEELSKNTQAANAIFRFFSLYLYADFADDKVYETEGEKFEDLKTTDYRTLKDRLKDLSNDIENYETLQKEYVKSYEELVIANFLFTNGINYEYERVYEVDTSTPEKRQYTPDFYLTDYGVYLEHYGININGKAPQYNKEEEQAYLQGIEWKRQTHKLNQTKCIESYSYEFKNGQIFDNLKKRLLDYGVELVPLSQEEIFNALHTIYSGQGFNSFFNLISTFLCLYKAQYPDSNGFEQLKRKSLGTNYDNERAAEFLEICKNIYEYYIHKLRSENKIDFDDMILQAITVLHKMRDYRYKYVIVDEFQDISQSRTKLLQKIIEHGDSKLFAVGDDWQAIYRFAGCDINVFLHFENYFEDVKLNYITSTHRNSTELQSIVEPFITANPEQYKKHIQSTKHQDSPVRIVYHNKNRLSAFTKALQNIAKINPKAEVLVLGRNKHDIDSIISKEVQISNYVKITHEKFPDMELTYKTVHQSKGLEREYVILISGENAKNGFPNKMEDDRLLDLVLGNKSGYEFAEERRLFYVALTRTRSIVYILSDKNKTSIFVKEVENRVKIYDTESLEREIREDRLCPYCKSGKLILHNTGRTSKPFYGCSNSPYCEFKINDLKAVKINNRCPDCGDFLVIRDGRWGKFIGCHNYPRCKFTRELNIDYQGKSKPIGFNKW